MPNQPTTVDEYLNSLPDDRRQAIELLRATVIKNLPKGFTEGIQYGMIGYFVPHSIYPNGYHCDPRQPLPFAHLASQKNHLAIYMMSLYMDPQLQAWFVESWKQTGHKLDMGKSCIRFKKIEDVPLKVIGQAIKKVSVKKYTELYEANLLAARKKPAKKTTRKKTAQPNATKKAASVKKSAKKSVTKSGAGKAAKKKVAKRPTKVKTATATKSPARKSASRKAPSKKAAATRVKKSSR